MPVDYSDINQPPAPDLGNQINSDLIALIAVKDGVVTDIVSGTTATGSPAIIDDADGKAWLGECTFNVADLGLDVTIGASWSLNVVGKFKASDGSDSDEACVEFLNIDNQYLSLYANTGWGKQYPILKGEWTSTSSSTKNVTHEAFALLAANVNRSGAKEFPAEIYLDGSLSNTGGYAKLATSNDLITLRVGNNDENIYLVALYSNHKTLAEFNGINADPWQLFSSASVANQANATLGLPPLSMSANLDTGLQANQANATITLPPLTLSASFDTSLPGNQASANLLLPGLTVSANFDTSIITNQANTTIILPALTATATANVLTNDALINASIVLPPLSMSASLDTSLSANLASATLTMPPLTLSASFDTSLPGNQSSANLLLPVLTISATLDTSLSANQSNATISLPALHMTYIYQAPEVMPGCTITLMDSATLLTLKDFNPPITLH